MTFLKDCLPTGVKNITIVDDSMSKQFSKEKGDNMSALPATVGGLSVDIPPGTVRRALAIAELSGSDTVSITISMERLVDMTQTVAGLVGQQLDIYYVGTYFCFRMPHLKRLDEEVDELMGSGVSTRPGNICVCIRKEVGSGSGCCGGTSGEAGDSKGGTCDTQTQQSFIGE